MVRSLGDLYFNFCVDRGPERFVSNIDVDRSEAFPFWPDAEAEDDLEHLMMGSQNIKTTNSYDCSGPFHTVENLEKRVLDRLEGWNKYKNAFGYACIFMHNGHTRDLYKDKCLVGDRLGWRDMFNTGPPKLEGGRVWGVVLECTSWHRQRRALLRSSFNRAALIHERDAHDVEDGGDEPDADDGRHDGSDDRRKEASNTLNGTADCYADLQLWGFLGVLFSLGSLLGRLKACFFKCPCHPKGFCERNDFMQQRRDCRLAGCIAPELSVGDHESFGEEMANKSFAELQEDLADLTQLQRDWCLQQWSAGRDFALGETRMRLRPHGTIPLKQHCLGPANIRLLRIHLARCVLIYDNLAEGDVTHSTSIALFSPTGLLRRAVEAVIEGAQDIERHPRLMHYRRRSRLAKCIEVSAERLHASLHRNIQSAPCHSGSYVSCMERKSHVLEIVQDSSESAQNFADCVSKVRTARNVIVQLGLQSHPRVEPFVVDGDVPADFPHKVAVEVVYRCDIESQFRPLANFCGQPPLVPPHGPVSAGALEDGPESKGPQDPPPDGDDDDDPFGFDGESQDQPPRAGDGGGHGGDGDKSFVVVMPDGGPEEYSPEEMDESPASPAAAAAFVFVDGGVVSCPVAGGVCGDFSMGGELTPQTGGESTPSGGNSFTPCGASSPACRR